MSTVLGISKIQIKTIMRYYLLPTRNGTIIFLMEKVCVDKAVDK